MPKAPTAAANKRYVAQQLRNMQDQLHHLQRVVNQDNRKSLINRIEASLAEVPPPNLIDRLHLPPPPSHLHFSTIQKDRRRDDYLVMIKATEKRLIYVEEGIGYHGVKESFAKGIQTLHWTGVSVFP